TPKLWAAHERRRTSRFPPAQVGREDIKRRAGAPPKNKGPRSHSDLGPSTKTPGSDLLSHTPTHAVPSAVAGLTSVFGMGTGGTLPLSPPGNLLAAGIPCKPH